MSLAFVAVIATTGGDTTGTTLVIPASTATGHDLYCLVNSDGHTAVTAYPTVTDNDSGGNLWTMIGAAEARRGLLFWKKATSATASKTVTIAGCVDSMSAGITVYSGGASGNPTTNWATANPAAGVNTQAGFVPSNADSMICLAVFNNDNITLTLMACTNPGTLEPERFDAPSTGGSDSDLIHGSALQVGGPTDTGAFTWSQDSRIKRSMVWAIKPEPTVGGPLPTSRSRIATKEQSVMRRSRW